MKDPRRVKKKEAAFSLLELLVILVILGIMAAIAIPAFSAWLPGYRLKAAARDIYSNLQRAKMGAIKSNECWGVFFDEGNSRYLIYSVGPNCAWDSGGGDDVYQNITIDLSSYEGVDYGHGSATKDVDDNLFTAVGDITHINDVVIFTNRGTVQNPGGYVYLVNSKGSSMGVGTPSPAGVIDIIKYNGSGWE